jgi:hypothetical protein
VLELELEVLLTLVLEVLVTEDEVLLLLVTLVLLVVTLVELVELLVKVLELELLPGNHSFSPQVIIQMVVRILKGTNCVGETLFLRNTNINPSQIDCKACGVRLI